MEKQFVLKAKTAVKRVAAISAGATMMGATMMGAVAADLGDYPSPFVSQGELNGMVVVGSASSAGDIVGAGDLISTLTQATVSASGSTTSTEGGEDFEVAMNSAFSAAAYNDEDIAGLIDGEVEFDDETYDVHEEIRVGTGMKLLISGPENEEDFTTNVYLGTDDAANEQFGYRYVFDTNATPLFADVDSNDTLTIDFLGSTIELTNMVNDTNRVTFNLADQVSLFAGESVTVDGKSITLKNVATNKVVIDVDGEEETVGTTAETVNGIKVKVHETFDSDNLADRFAVLLVGEDITQTVDHQDVFEMFGLSDDADENPWEWDIEMSSEGTSYIGVTYVYSSDDAGDDFPPYVLGDSLELPNNFGALVLDSLTNDDYTRVTFDFGQSRNIDGTPEDVITVSADVDDAFLMNDTDKVDTFYIHDGADAAAGVEVSWKDDDGDWNTEQLANLTSGTVESYTDVAELVYGDGSTDDVDFEITTFDFGDHYDIELNGYTGIADVEITTNYTGGDFVLGAAEDDESSGEIDVGGTDISSRDFDNLFANGLIVYDPEANANGAGQVIIDYPAEVVEGNVIVTGPGSVTTNVVYSSVTVNSVAGQSVIKLDTEVTDPASRNLILVGGPAVNRLTAQAMGLTYPTTGADSGIPEGAALIRLVENAFGGSNSALVVAGWDAEDTRAAASVLQNYRSYANSLDGRMEVQVSGTSVTAVGGDVATN